MNGLSFLQRVKGNPNRAHLPFLIVTSPISHEAEKVIMAAENMVDAYIIKPFRGSVLKDKIEKVLSQAIRGPQRQVLVVDDDEDARTMVMEYLKQLGFKDILGEPDGKSAFLYLSQNIDRVGLIVSDWEMPEMSGIELLRALKENPKLADIPFLMITSQSSVERMKVMQAARANVDQYLLKPFGTDEFRKRVEELLDRSKSYARVRDLTVEATDMLERGRYIQAQEKFEEIIQLNPDHDVSLRALGDIALKTKDANAALPYYKRAVEANPVSAKSYIKLAQAYEQVGWTDKAVSLLLAGNQQVSFNADLHFALGQLYMKKNMVQRAQEEFQKTLEIQLDHQEARLMLELIRSQE
jgi:two-component system chemotaxis response regulator CheY